jgi:hypothetical protein
LEHGWKLLLGITEPVEGCGNEPIWRTWFTKEEVFRPPVSGHEPRAAMLSLERPLTINEFLPILDTRGAVFSKVLFNQPAMSHIQNNRLYQRSVLDEFRSQGRREIPEFPRDAVAIKTIWRAVPANPNGDEQKMVKLSVWSESAKQKANGEMLVQQKWLECVNVTAGTVDEEKRPCLAGDGQPILGRTVGVGEFYNIKIETLAERDLALNLLKDPKPGELAVGDFLILLGMHVTTKEIPDWAWATFWWHPSASESTPSEILTVLKQRGAWKNYAMDATFSMRSPHDSDGNNKAIYNPYLEASAVPKGTRSNCMTCHSSAAYIAASMNSVKTDGRAQELDRLEGLVRTDFIWSILTHVVPPN